MLSPGGALAAAARPAPRAAAAQRRVLVLGGGGALGAAVLEQLLASHRFASVGVVASASLQPALRGLRVVAAATGEALDGAALAAFAPDTALVVFDRERHANGREAAFVRPPPALLPTLAGQLHAAGARTLIVVVPHTPALLPQALKLGLASLDEAAVAALGFEQLVLMRMAQAGGGARPVAARGFGHRVAGWLLAQLQWLVPQTEQPVRSSVVARVAAQLAVALPQAPAGTRVLDPDLLWQAAQGGDVATLVDDWLAGRPGAPFVKAARLRL